MCIRDRVLKEVIKIFRGHGDHHIAQNSRIVASDSAGSRESHVAFAGAKDQILGTGGGAEDTPVGIKRPGGNGGVRGVKAQSFSVADVKTGVLPQLIGDAKQQLLQNAGIRAFLAKHAANGGASA